MDIFESAEAYFNARIQTDLFLLDINLPGISGIELCKRIRERDLFTPIILLTANPKEAIAVEALSSGGQDFVRKPFSVAELIARINLHLRFLSRDEVRVAELTINSSSKKVQFRSQDIKLTRNEFHLLFSFIDNPDVLFTRERLLDLISAEEDTSDRSIDTTLSRLKAKLKNKGVDCIEIQSVYGEGYRAVIKR